MLAYTQATLLDKEAEVEGNWSIDELAAKFTDTNTHQISGSSWILGSLVQMADASLSDRNPKMKMKPKFNISCLCYTNSHWQHKYTVSGSKNGY